MRFGLLGPMELTDGPGDPVQVTGPRIRVLLAALLLHANQPVACETLAEAVWDGSPPSGAATSLRSYISRLRRALGPLAAERVAAREPGYVIRLKPTELDVLEFEQLCRQARAALQECAWPQASTAATRALELWRGTPLADVPSQPLRDRTVPRLKQLRLQAFEDRAQAELHLGRHEQLLPELRELTMHHPLREKLHAQLMLALARAGRQAEALEAYQAVRRMLVDQLGIEPGPELRGLHARILTGDPAPVAVSRDGDEPQGSARKPAAVPRQLPAGVPHFAGRAEALKALTELAGRGADAGTGAAVAISAIGGTAGIGKTALAVHWARLHADRFPDGQLYVNLHGFDPSGAPLEAPTVVRGFLDALGVPAARVPADVDAQAALYRSSLADRRVLIVLDNARDTGQVRPLLPGSTGCLVLVTSRSRLSGLVALDGAVPLALDLLTHDEAADLLVRRLSRERTGAEPKAVDALIGLCARLPLALNIVAARASLQPALRLGDLAGELRDTRRRLDTLATEDGAADVRIAFSWSYRALGAEAARMFRLLGLHPGPDTTVPAAASLAALDHDGARRALGELTAAHLLTEHVPGRYSFHDLLRDYAVEQARIYESEETRNEAARRLVDHHVHSAYAAAGLLHSAWGQADPGPSRGGVLPERFADAEDAVRWFDRERQVLISAIGRAFELRLDPEVCRLAGLLANALDRGGHWDEMAATQTTALAAAMRHGDVGDQANAHRLLGRANSRRADYGSAHEHYSAAADLYRKLGDRGSEAFIHLDTAWTLERQSLYREAFDHAGQALDLHRQVGDQVGQALALNVVGWYRSLLGDHRRALADCQVALDLNRRCGNHSGEAFSRASIGHAHHHLGEHEQAMASYRQAMELFCTIGDRYMQAQILSHLGDTHQAVGDRVAVRDTWRRALAILEDLQHPDADMVRAKISDLDGEAWL